MSKLEFSSKFKFDLFSIYSFNYYGLDGLLKKICFYLCNM